MNEAELLQKTEAALPGFAPDSLIPIEKGGSSRHFFRVTSGNAHGPKRSAILVRDLGEKEENRHYAALAGFLASHGVPVPGVLATSDGDGLLWLEDLGETDLWATRHDSWDIRRPLYESTLRGIALLHRIPADDPEAKGLHLQFAFDERLYRWEQEYFLTHCLGEIFGVGEQDRKALLDHSSMKQLACELASLPRQLVHRDFQSQNILIRNGEACFIDFQGMRPGVAQYDLASLLCDPYVEISAGERAHLLAVYKDIVRESGAGVSGDFDRVFWRCAVQRLMQALGAYGFLSIHRGKTAFRSHVSPALIRLREALANLHPDDQLNDVASVVGNLKLDT